jgi:hypothetical protein
MAGVPVDRLQYYVEEHDYLICPDKVVAEWILYLVDLSEAEALDAMGDNRAAVELIERDLL